MATPKKLSVRARAIANGYRSGLEETIAASLNARGCTDWIYEKHVLPYTVPARTARYTPDVCLPNGIVCELKGLWDSDDRKKLGLIKEQFPGLELRMVFSNARAKISKVSKTTYAMVCEKLGIPYATKDIPSSWLEEPPHERSLAILESLRK